MVTKLRPDIPQKVYVLAARGTTKEKIAAALGITSATLRRWLKYGRNEESGRILKEIALSYDSGRSDYRNFCYNSVFQKVNDIAVEKLFGKNNGH
jgi:transcriptional regulator with XRE-family HTH domain